MNSHNHLYMNSYHYDFVNSLSNMSMNSDMGIFSYMISYVS